MPHYFVGERPSLVRAESCISFPIHKAKLSTNSVAWHFFAEVRLQSHNELFLVEKYKAGDVELAPFMHSFPAYHFGLTWELTEKDCKGSQCRIEIANPIT